MRAPWSRRTPALLPAVALVALLVGACGGAGEGGAAPSGVVPSSNATSAGHTVLAPELEGLSGWLNSPSLTLAALRRQGRVVLIDFWTYTCVNCQRTLPFLRQWDEKYAVRGLTIIGVHTPEFDFEHDPTNVAAAVAAAGIHYAVAQDNEMKTWNAFHNNVWPAKYLIGADGRIRYTHLGEGDYDATEQAIRAALTDAGFGVSDIATGGIAAPAIDPTATVMTRELYGGYERNYATNGVYAAQRDYYAGPDLTHDYVDPGQHRPNQWYLQGRWRNEAQAVVHARSTEQLEDYLALRFTARSVNVVMHPGAAGRPYDVVVEVDGEPLAANAAGADVHFDALGRSVVTVDEPRMYSVVLLPAVGEHELKLRSNSEDCAIYALTFGVYTRGA